jgi:predicted nucleic acid-binding protein
LFGGCGTRIAISVYADTSIVVAALTNESRTADAQVWLRAQLTGNVTISDWVITEFSSALSLKLRVGTITADQRAIAMASFRRLIDRSFEILTITPPMFRNAASFADQHALGIRAGDALHLAVALENGADLWTLDHRMSQAGPAVGVVTRLL